MQVTCYASGQEKKWHQKPPLGLLQYFAPQMLLKFRPVLVKYFGTKYL